MMDLITLLAKEHQFLLISLFLFNRHLHALYFNKISRACNLKDLNQLYMLSFARLCNLIIFIYEWGSHNEGQLPPFYKTVNLKRFYQFIYLIHLPPNITLLHFLTTKHTKSHVLKATTNVLIVLHFLFCEKAKIYLHQTFL